ncbi:MULTISPECIES: hypothetical protein [unclassified Pseudofrankia]|uniref:hypothetical protein n=1 Tax=unclassified Pseudofrankia TaxID=2994372 RepID=UPI0008DA0589|nr:MULTISPECIES: hypothetical protein [unclassified Pseudofrankia]MDT3446379.1 hypothetical protein [Pseudofrankia sp. BMG5.37]OHV59311.1 hypothetical protein BCD48_41465 [Pseudofrankia sp. BMG5.36]
MSGRRGHALPLSIAAVSALFLAALAGCSGEGVPSPRPSASASPTPLAPKTPPGLTPISRADFQKALSDVDAALGPGFGAVGGAQTPSDLSGALGAVALNLGVQADALDRLRPPLPSVTATKQLAAALRSLSKDLTAVATDADIQRVCTGASGMPHVANSPGADAFRLAFLALITANPGHPYTFGAFLPGAGPDPNRRPGNGALPGGRRGGYGKLTVDNQRTVDTVVKIMSGGDLIRAIYVQAGAQATVDAMPNGTYEAFYTSGTDWDDGGRRFTRDCEFEKFDDPLQYTTRTTSTAIEYSVWTLTLLRTSSLGSGAPTSPVEAGAFPGA